MTNLDKVFSTGEKSFELDSLKDNEKEIDLQNDEAINQSDVKVLVALHRSSLLLLTSHNVTITYHCPKAKVNSPNLVSDKAGNLNEV